MTLPRDLRYPLGLDIEAGTRHAAIMAAGERLRTGVSVTKLRSAEQFAPGWWRVEMLVRETAQDLAPKAEAAS